MKRGLVIGKFLPLHAGHIALIRFAALQCEELIVSISANFHDTIDPQVRHSWIVEVFKEQPSIKVEMISDDFDNEELSFPDRAEIWAGFIRKRFPKVDVVFSSEEYGDPLAEALGAFHILFDQQRKHYPVSSTMIRKNPFLYWEYIPEIVRPYFVRKICFYGPESTGKSTMAKHLAALYNTEYVPEVAREMITSNEFTIEDIIRIGYAQIDRVQEKVKKANKILFCDTDVITTQIYAAHYLHQVPPILYELEKSVKYDLYFLFQVDVPWVADGLRDLAGARENMYAVFKTELVKRNIPFIQVDGNYEAREKKIRASIDDLLKANG